jgi:hypothetical protein
VTRSPVYTAGELRMARDIRDIKVPLFEMIVPGVFGPMPNQSNPAGIEGAWRMESRVRDGEAVSLTGVLLMTAGRWSTLYFIPQPGANECWGSAESGRYDVKGDQLTFHHEFTFQGGGDKQILIDLASIKVEVCKIVLTSEVLEIYFPSGNVIHCRRYSE